MPTTGPRLYAELAHLWPHLSPPEHYQAEAETLIELIDEALGEPTAGRRWSVLEIGAGAGHTIAHLSGLYDCTAADLSPQMLEHCKTLNPGVPTIVGDMRDMRLGQTFDVVLLCDAIDYMTSPGDAAAALKTVAAHLRPGGVTLIAPTYTRETFIDCESASDRTDTDTPSPHADAPPDVTYFSFVHDPDPSDTRFEMILLYLLRDPRTRAVQVIEDRHACGLFSIEQWQEMMLEAGLEAEALAQPADNDDENAPDSGPGAWSVLFRATR